MSKATEHRVLGIPGSLRSGSFNRKLLDNAAELAPAGTTLDVLTLHDLPPYDQDQDGDEKPAPVLRLRQAIRQADGVLLVTPEHNYGVPGVLKNAIDWASRPAFRSPFRDKPVGILSASPAPTGGARAQEVLKTVLLGMASAVMPWPEVTVGRCGEKFDGDDRLSDEEDRSKVAAYLASFDRWVDAVSGYASTRPETG
jgi:chromate reductase